MTNWKKRTSGLVPLALVGSVACATLPESEGESEDAVRSVSQNIFFGHDAVKGEQPWMAMLSYDFDDDGDYEQNCGGALVAPNWVLTAQHCVYPSADFDEQDRLPKEIIRVTLGEHDKSNTSEGSEQVRGVKRIVYREPYDNRFDPLEPGEPNDIALIELDSPVQINQYTKVVKFASGGDGPTPAGEPAQFAGWGYALTQDPVELYWPDILQSADLSVRPNSVCNDLNVNYNLPPLVDAKEMCVGGDGEPGTCNKDSGGPLTVVRESGCPELIGALSWGPECGASNVFTRVSAHVDWIREYVGVYEAEEMTHVTGGPHAEGWNIWDNSYISFTNTFEGGPQDMVVTAAAGYGDGWPIMRVTVNGQEELLVEVDSADWEEYPFSFDAPAGNAEVRIYLTNDVYFERDGETVDRNLFLDKVRVVENGSSSCTAPAGSISAELEVFNQWSTGYCARVKVTNGNSVPTTDWLVVINSGNSSVNQRWNTDFISGTGTHNLGPIGWNNAIQPGVTNSDTGFCATRPAGSNILPTLVSASATY